MLAIANKFVNYFLIYLLGKDLLGYEPRFASADYGTFSSCTQSIPSIYDSHALSHYTADTCDHNFAKLTHKSTQKTYKSVDFDASLSTSNYMGQFIVHWTFSWFGVVLYMGFLFFYVFEFMRLIIFVNV